MSRVHKIGHRAGLFALGVAVTTTVTPLHAQGFGENITRFVSPPADRVAVAGGGVDMRSGRYAFSQTDVSIGEGATGGLALTREPRMRVSEAFGNFSHNYAITLTETLVDMTRLNYEHGSGVDYRISVRFAGRADTFEAQHFASGYVPPFAQVSQRANVGLTSSGNRNGPSVVYTYQGPDGTLVTFRALGSMDCDAGYRCAYPSHLIYPDGTQLTFEYDSLTPGTPNTTRLRSVVSSRGYALLLEYSGVGAGPLNITKACVLNLTLAPKPSNNTCPTSALGTSTYTYTNLLGMRLASATDAANGTWSYGYVQTSGGIDMSFTRPGENDPWLTNRLHDRANADGTMSEVIDSQYLADGQQFVYEYTNTLPLTGDRIDELAGGSFSQSAPQSAAREITVRYDFPRRPRSLNPLQTPNQTTQERYGDAFYQVTPGPVEVTDALGRTTTYDYCDPGFTPTPNVDIGDTCLVDQLHSYTDPEGIRTELTYHPQFNHVIHVRRIPPEGSGLDVIDTSASYQCYDGQAVLTPKTCVQPATVTDANGNTTTRTYSPVHGGVLTETGPAVNGVQPQTRFQYAERQARLSDGTEAGPEIWVLTGERFCRTTAANGPTCAGGAADEVTTEYDYGPTSGPNNLLLRGTTVTSVDNGVETLLRTCYGYDALGRRISETQPNANLAACP
jgi:hypothetical protein